MNTGTTKIDKWYIQNMEMLKTYCSKYNMEEDVVNEVYLKLNGRIKYLTGMTDNEMFMYVRKSLWNYVRDNHKKEKRIVKKIGYGIPMEGNENIVEETLNEMDFNEEEYHNELEWFTKKVFKYIKERGIFTDMEVFILKSYVWTDCTYAELENKIGISQDVCKKTMRKFRQDLRWNFLTWLNNDSK